MTTTYRNYLIAKVGDVYVARGDDEHYMISTDRLRLNTAIDEVWTALEHGREPAWFSGSAAIDLDHLAIEAEVVKPSVFMKATEDSPKKVGYVTFFATAVFVAAPLSMICNECLPKRVDTMLTLGVCAVAVTLGRNFALIATVIAALSYDFFVGEPLYSFSWPTWSEIGFWTFNLVASFGLPELLKRREQIQAWWVQSRIGRI
jgi:K+-sensing histidine kinase KdpD